MCGSNGRFFRWLLCQIRVVYTWSFFRSCFDTSIVVHLPFERLISICSISQASCSKYYWNVPFFMFKVAVRSHIAVLHCERSNFFFTFLYTIFTGSFLKLVFYFIRTTHYNRLVRQYSENWNLWTFRWKLALFSFFLRLQLVRMLLLNEIIDPVVLFSTNWIENFFHFDLFNDLMCEAFIY